MNFSPCLQQGENALEIHRMLTYRIRHWSNYQRFCPTSNQHSFGCESISKIEPRAVFAPNDGLRGCPIDRLSLYEFVGIVLGVSDSRILYLCSYLLVASVWGPTGPGPWPTGPGPTRPGSRVPPRAQECYPR